jgi:predicted RNA-binding protein YlqC (UPF0109 family)
MKELLEFILKNLLADKEFSVEEKLDGDKVNLTILVPQDKIGLIIGKEGKVIKSIRNLLRVKATLEKKVVFLSVEEKK